MSDEQRSESGSRSRARRSRVREAIHRPPPGPIFEHGCPRRDIGARKWSLTTQRPARTSGSPHSQAVESGVAPTARRRQPSGDRATWRSRARPNGPASPGCAALIRSRRTTGRLLCASILRWSLCPATACACLPAECPPLEQRRRPAPCQPEVGRCAETPADRRGRLPPFAGAGFVIVSGSERRHCDAAKRGAGAGRLPAGAGRHDRLRRARRELSRGARRAPRHARRIRLVAEPARGRRRLHGRGLGQADRPARHRLRHPRPRRHQRRDRRAHRAAGHRRR